MFHNYQLSDYLLPMVCVYRQLVLQTLQCLLHRLTVWVATELEEQIIVENLPSSLQGATNNLKNPPDVGHA